VPSVSRADFAAALARAGVDRSGARLDTIPGVARRTA